MKYVTIHEYLDHIDYYARHIQRFYNKFDYHPSTYRISCFLTKSSNDLLVDDKVINIFKKYEIRCKLNITGIVHNEICND